MGVKDSKVKIEALIPDDKNFNKGTQYGAHLMEKSVEKFGFGRSILVDKNNRVIAGNKTLQTCAEAGYENVRIIETTGDEIIAVKRVDVDLDSKQGREMALADNATSKANLEWDEELLQEASQELDIDTEAWGVMQDEDVNFNDLFEENAPVKDKDTFVVQVHVPNKYEDIAEDIKAAISITLQEWEGCSVK